MASPSFHITAIELYERPVTLRIPFRFGRATVTEAPQAFVRARIRCASSDRTGTEGCGAAAELMIPKWFDKSPAKSNADNIADLRESLGAAADAYLSEKRAMPAFAHFAAHYGALIADGAKAGRNALISSYGAALIDRALLDALCSALGVSFQRAIRANLPGIDATLTPDIAGIDMDRFLESLAPCATIAARHTVGLVDPIVGSDATTRSGDGLPETLEEVIAAYGNRHFKLKLSGDLPADVARVSRIAAVLDRLPRYAITLDGNEQYADAAAVAEFWRRVDDSPELARLAASTLYLEQPLPRDRALDVDVAVLGRRMPLLIDESDATLDAFPTARAQGYTGVSSKCCKGFYKSLLNAARCASWNAEAGTPRAFLSGEDLTMQAGLGVQQDLALVGLLGLQHVERNGHHYVDGFAGQGASAAEQQRFLVAHPELYEMTPGGVRLAIHRGTIALGSLAAPGFASSAQPDWAALAPLTRTVATAV